MAELYDLTEELVLTPIVESCIPKRQVNMISNYSLDGTFYSQIIGVAPTQYDVVCYAPRDSMMFIEDAFANGRTLRVTMSAGLYYGIVMDFQKSYLLNDYYKIELTLAQVPAPTEQSEP